MIVDDRLETVLRTPAAGVAAARIRFRQLVDLLGRLSDLRWTASHKAALVSLDQFAKELPEPDCVKIIEITAIRSAVLVRHLASGEPRIAAAAMSSARLPEHIWLDLIPDLPVRARGFLRHRRDLGPTVERLLERFGVGDLVLPNPEAVAPAQTEIAAPEPEAAPEAAAPISLVSATAPPPPAPAPVQAPIIADEEPLTGIGAIVRRIEAFRKARDASQDQTRNDPRLPLGDDPIAGQGTLTEIQFRTDAEGAVVWADGSAQSLLWGHSPFTAEPSAPARCDFGTLRSVRGRAPIREGRLDIDGTEAIRGAWRIDAIPLFADRGGRFTGYLGRLRRPQSKGETPAQNGSDRLRQLLHELRTPVNAIQGFAELIQQQIFGPTPHEYRSLAASIASDAARILGGFDDIDRLVKLETGQLKPEAGMGDLGSLFDRLIIQLEQVVAPREVRLKVERPTGALMAPVDETELERMLWRVLAVIGSAAQPGERLRFILTSDATGHTLFLPLPATQAARIDDELFAPDSSGAAVFPSTAMLGSGFALRLAAAEARGAGGSLKREGNRLVLNVPLAISTQDLKPLANSATTD